MKIGISLPIRELMDDLGAVREFAQAAEELATLPDGSAVVEMISDYVVMRDQVRDCG